MRPLAALEDGVSVAVRTPLLVAVFFALGLLGAASALVQQYEPLLALPYLGLTYLLLPFVIGGAIALVDAALDGRPSLDAFVGGGRDGYVSIFAGALVLGVLTGIVYFVVAVLMVVAIAVLAGAVLASGGSDLGTATIAVVVAVTALGFLVMLLPWFFLQFFPAAVVLEDRGMDDAFTRSVELVKNNALSVVGFVLLAGLFGLLAQIPTAYMVYVAAQSPEGLQTSRTMFELMSRTQLAIYLGATVLVGTVLGPISISYYVAYFRKLVESDPDSDQGADDPATEPREDPGPTPPAD